MKYFSGLASRFSSFIHPLLLKRIFQIGRTIVQDLVRCDVLRQASAMAYVTLLSLVPSLVAIFCVISLFSPLVAGHLSLIDKLRQFILANLATGSGESVISYLDNMLKDLDFAKIGWSSFASVLVTLILLLRQIEEALNKIWLIRRARNVFLRFMYFWSFLTLGLVVLGTLLGASSGFDLARLLRMHEASPVHDHFGWLWGIVGGGLFFFALYKVVPNCKVKSWTAAIGSLVAAFLLQQAGRLYGIYVKDARNYQTLYGALAQLPLFLTWLYICWVVILLGALISWRLQEGFPPPEEDTFSAKTPMEHWRDTQVRGVLPILAMLAIYKHFETGEGDGVKAQNLGKKLDLPLLWVAESLDILVALGYIVATQNGGRLSVQEGDEAYFPRLPAESLTLAKIRRDFAKPLSDVLAHWQKLWPLNFDLVFMKIFQRDEKASDQPAATLSSLLVLIPDVSKP